MSWSGCRWRRDAKDAPLLADRALVGAPARLGRGDPPLPRRAVRARAREALREAGDPAQDPLVAAYAARLARIPDGPPAGWSPVTRLDSK